MKRTTLAWFACASLLGCSGAPVVGVSTQPIIGGTTDDGDANVVMVVSQVPGSMQASLCTGEIISPHVVLTAAHCVDPALIGMGAQTYVFTGTTLPRPVTLSDLLTTQATHYDLAFDPGHPENGHDIGVAILSNPTSIAPLPYNRKPITSALFGQPARLIGYGITDSTDTKGDTAGTRREAPSVLTGLDANNSTLVDYQDGMHGICEGDSGGPGLMMIDGVERIVSVTSFGFQTCPTDQPGAETRVDIYLGFVDQYVTQLDPPAVKAGDPCSSDTDCAPLSCTSTSAGKVCTTPCDPTAVNDTTCTNGTMCTSVDGANLCVKPMSGNGNHSGGCAIGGRAATPGAAALLLVALGALLSRRRRI